MTERRTCDGCQVVARRADGEPSTLRGWWLHDGELLCAACRRERGHAPPAGGKIPARKKQAEARAQVRAEYPEWSRAQVEAYLALPAPPAEAPKPKPPKPQPKPRPASGSDQAAALFRQNPTLSTREVVDRLGVSTFTAQRGRRIARGQSRIVRPNGPDSDAETVQASDSPRR